eukprot:gene15350-36860_t
MAGTPAPDPAARCGRRAPTPSFRTTWRAAGGDG